MNTLDNYKFEKMFYVRILVQIQIYLIHYRDFLCLFLADEIQV